MSKPEWDKFGEANGNTRWFHGTVRPQRKLVQTFQEIWSCPVTPCDGEMIYNGMMWPTGDPGFHHTCNKCGFTAAIHGAKYPRMTNYCLKGGWTVKELLKLALPALLVGGLGGVATYVIAGPFGILLWCVACFYFGCTYQAMRLRW